MDFKEALIRAIEEMTPGLTSAINWHDIDAVLVISHTRSNQGDLHRTTRERLGVRIGGNKTHIDLTSGDDVLPGLSPVTDFCDQVSDKFIYHSKCFASRVSGV